MSPIWSWVHFMLQLMSTQLLEAVQLTLWQAIIGEPLDYSVSVPNAWWASLCTATIWFVWIARNEERPDRTGESYRLPHKSEFGKN